MKKLLVTIMTFVTALACIFAFTACVDNGDKDDDKKYNLNLKYYSDASEMLPALKTKAITTGLLPEPAATKLTLMDNTYSSKLDVQTLYGGDYPQAVILAKNSVIENDNKFITEFITSLIDTENWIKANTANAVNAVNDNLKEGLTPSLQASSITETVVDNCNIYFESASDAKKDVKNYINDIIQIESASSVAPSDDFFYTASETETSNLNGSYKVVMPDGAPALALSELIYNNNQFNRTVEYDVVSASTIGTYVAQKSADIVIMPVNAGCKIAGNGQNYKMLGVITHGNLFVMSNENVTNLKDLDGKTVGVIGRGNVPDLTFKAILSKNNIGYTEI